VVRCWADFWGVLATTTIPIAGAFIIAEVSLYFIGLGRHCPKGDK
jgi:ABC-type dipeptide/oligopeptide/nickel transport system permease subunit